MIDFRKSTCRTCKENCAVRDTINHADPDAHCPIWKWKDAGWRARQRGTQKRPAMPPIGVTVTNAAVAAVRAAEAALSEQGFWADESTIQERREICAACPQLVNNRCAKCGCFYKAKIKLRTEKCPLGKWPTR